MSSLKIYGHLRKNPFQADHANQNAPNQNSLDEVIRRYQNEMEGAAGTAMFTSLFLLSRVIPTQSLCRRQERPCKQGSCPLYHSQ